MLDNLHVRPGTVSRCSRGRQSRGNSRRDDRASPRKHRHDALLPHGRNDHRGGGGPERRLQLRARHAQDQEQEGASMAHRVHDLYSLGHPRQPHHINRDDYDPAQARERPQGPHNIRSPRGDSSQLRRCVLANRRRNHHHAMEQGRDYGRRSDKGNHTAVARS